MQVARKITLPLVLSAFAVLGVASYFSVRADREIQRTDMLRDQRVAAQVLVTAVRAEAQHSSREKALALVNEANTGQSRVLFTFVPENELASRGMLDAASIQALDRGETLFLVDETVWGNASTWVPLALPDGTRGALWVQEPLTAQQESLNNIIGSQVGTALALGVLWAIVAIGLGAVIVGRPMRLLAEKARRTGQGDLSGPLTITQADEIGELANEMNRMCEELLASQRRLEEWLVEGEQLGPQQITNVGADQSFGFDAEPVLVGRVGEPAAQVGVPVSHH
jgi:two-component system NtrC family sensor kinase